MRSPRVVELTFREDHSLFHSQHWQEFRRTADWIKELLPKLASKIEVWASSEATYGEMVSFRIVIETPMGERLLTFDFVADNFRFYRGDLTGVSLPMFTSLPHLLGIASTPYLPQIDRRLRHSLMIKPLLDWVADLVQEESEALIAFREEFGKLHRLLAV